MSVATAVATAFAARAVDVTKTYGEGAARVEALRGVSLDLPAGAFTSVMGPSGSGKSTLMHCLAGLDTVDGGRVEVAGADVTAMRDRERTLLRRDKIGFVFQAFNLVPSLTARENIELPLMLAGRAPDEAWFDQLVTTLRLGDRLTHTPAELSGGQQQRVAIARALLNRPAVVFADEPTGNLDSRTSGELLVFLREAVTTLGQTILMVTHDPIAASHSDAVVVLTDGRVVATMPDPTVAGVLDLIKGLGG